MDIKELQKKIKKNMDKDRFDHTRGVMYTAAALAMAYEYDINKAMIAGLLHDCTKRYSDKEQLSICQEYDIHITSSEKENPFILHQKTGAVIAKEEYGIDDPDILHAISVHTTGAIEMNLLDKIIFIADYIEPGRDKAPHLTELRKEAFEDINACVADILFDTLHHLNNKKAAIDPTTRYAYEYYSQFEREQPWKH